MNDLAKVIQVSPAMSTPNTPYVNTIDAMSCVGISILENSANFLLSACD